MARKTAGAAPIVRGTVDYDANPSLDRDNDGVACEQDRGNRKGATFAPECDRHSEGR